ncbi:glycerophosphodiester phosphodiesterase [Kaustia mangrovi]|uniref:Glycerophosphodiester phosphodiesterase n=1 Tax=Kaustia mangrovi TaxID=2593653 RepID=A0A7S8HDC3_9HYPH|nr:glycerophosphodiester phosphodiesterase family protein [Kaustia mangrovi]QPC44536.1 glycerophosphodiester phosphodiesterase [Kaustia mangrovi]
MWWRLGLALVLLLAGFVYLNNTTLLASRPAGEPVLLAHRGIAQRYHTEGLDYETCTAERILPPTHDYLENTIASMRASFEAGADIVEFDIHPTTDGQFAVFHDWTLDCRTDGTGVTREHSMAQLKALDIGYGYTADGGETFPFRGKGVGAMPSLEEVLAAFPDRRFLINVKSRDRDEGARLAAVLAALPPDRRANFMVYGGTEPVEAVHRALPEVKTVSRSAIKDCLIRYVAYGWTGLVPEACRNRVVPLPVNIAPWLWGWPDRLVGRMRSVGSSVFLLGPYGGGGFSTGIDTAEDIARIPDGYAGGVWTNEIETVAGTLRK